MKKAFIYMKNFIAPNTKKAQHPILLNFPITDNCNSKCIMCNVWKDKVDNEIDVQKINDIFSKEYFKEVKHIGISGGEPTLRKDLVECVEVIFKKAKKLESLSITSHGYHSKRWSRFAPKLVVLSKKYNVKLSVNISIDGIDEIHDKIRGTKGAFKRACTTISVLANNFIPVQLQCTVSKDNIYSLSGILEFAKQEKVDCIFRCATDITRLYNSAIIEGISLNQDQKSFLADFFLSETLHNFTKSISRGLYYEKMAELLSNSLTVRNMPCYFQRQGMLLTSKGEISTCSVSKNVLANVLSEQKNILLTDKEVEERNKTIDSECVTCIHDQSGAWSPVEILSYLSRRRYQKLANYFNLLTKSTILLKRLIFITANKPKPSPIHEEKIKTAMIIGAYGGEHVGDAAILGGVILRCLNKYNNLEKIYVSSFRKDRTQRWVNSLDFPITIECVDDTKAIDIKFSIDLLIYGGGPLMELPLHLANHLYTAIKYSKVKVPFILEGVGLGPLRTKTSSFLVKRLLQTASYTRVRTNKALSDAYNMIGKNVDLGQDPAFDYLASRSIDNLNRLTTLEKNSLEDILKQKDDSFVLGINLRPLWEKYSFLENENIEDVENRYLNTLVKSFSELNSRYRIRFVFFPMNADQFGMSDFLTANKLKHLMNKDNLKLNIWNCEPGIDAMIYFLNAIDGVLSMRFHGCIFALSQNKDNVISIDYQLGKPGKVTNVMDDNGVEKMTTRADNIDVKEITNKIETILKKTNKYDKTLSNENIIFQVKT